MNYKTDPTTSADMVFSSESAKEKLYDMISQNQPFPCSGKNSLLLYGTYGSGKTTYAKVFLNDFEQYSGGTAPSIEFIRCEKAESITSIIKMCNSIANSQCFYHASNCHYFIFDEIDNLTTDAQRALKSFMNRKNVVCVLTTNYLDKIDEGVKSRCELINFNATHASNYIWRLKKILVENHLPMVSANVMTKIVHNSNGNWRDIIPVLLRTANTINTGKSPVCANRLLKVI